MSEIDWAEGAPRSRRYGDIYYHPTEGLAESRHTFLTGCGLPEGWQDRDLFVIGETGFGTGLNFLATIAAFVATAGDGQRLHFVSVEGSPLGRAELARAHAAFPELEPWSRALLEVYPDRPWPGFQRLHLSWPRVTLDLLVGEVGAMLDQLEGQIDAWYLDGFAPARNPQMWRPAVLAELARLSRPGARLATFTAAGAVRRGLAAVGFAAEKAPGYGAKRERIVARFEGEAARSRLPAWARSRPLQGPVAVVGAGVAGSATVCSLARRGIACGWSSSDAARASEVPRGVVMPRLAVDDNAPSRFYQQAFRYAVQQYAAVGLWQPGGVLQPVRDATELERAQRIAGRWAAAEYIDATEASERAGLALTDPALWLPDAGVVDTARWLAQPMPAADVDEPALTIWATGIGTTATSLASALPLQAFRGQVTLAEPTARTQSLRCTLAAGRFITPAVDGLHMIGSTFDRVAADAPMPGVTDADHRRNIEGLGEDLPDLDSDPWQIRGGWVGVRAALPDRFPAAGFLPPIDSFLDRYGGLRHGPVHERRPPLEATHGVLTGLGARGYTAAPLAAELLVSQWQDEPWPVPRDVALALHPARFLVRNLKRER